jgi:hypothetical protein
MLIADSYVNIAGEKMSNAGAKRKADHLNEYEKQRDANIMKKNQRMKELNIQTLVQEVNSSHAQQRKQKVVLLFPEV